MYPVFLTAYNGAILGPIAKALGWIMNGIYSFFANVCGVESVALVIFIFTIFIYLCLFPVTYRTQKFSVLTRKIAPETKAIQEKYKGKRDQASMTAMNEETQAVYDKYGISPMGSCVYMIIQMPILFALYRVFFNIPAYLSSVKGVFSNLVDGIVATDGYAKTMQAVYDQAGINTVKVDFTATDTTVVKNYITDVLYKLSDTGWDNLSASFPGLSDVISSTHGKLEQINYFLTLNISDTPINLIKTNFAHNPAIWVLAVLVPILAYGSQFLNMKMTPVNSTDPNDQMAKQMRTMNILMPLMSLFFSVTVPVGLSLYWIAGALVRTVQQIFLNRHFEKIDIDGIIEKNKEKARAKQEKRGIQRERMLEAANMSTRKISMADKAHIGEEKTADLDAKEEARNRAPRGSMSAKANMVKEYNDKNTRK